MLALVPGLLFFLGMGHLYLGRVGRGVVLLVSGWVVFGLAWALFLLGVSALAFSRWTALILILGGLVLMGGGLALWMWQTLDARKLQQRQQD